MIVGVFNIYIGASVGSHVAMPRLKKKWGGFTWQFSVTIQNLSHTHNFFFWCIGRLK
jgi:hypothetical protein